jgi:hypothetical protein
MRHRHVGLLALGVMLGCGAPTTPQPAQAPSIEDAAAFLEELEERIRDASSVAIDAEVIGEAEPAPGSIAVTAEGSRFAWRWRATRNGAQAELTIDADDREMRIRAGSEDATAPAPAEPRELLAIGVVRAGLLSTASSTLAGDELRELSDGRPCCWAELIEPVRGEPTVVDGVTVVPISAQTGAFGQPRGTMTLYVDPVRRVPVRRETTMRTYDEEPHPFVERYTRFEIR